MALAADFALGWLEKRLTPRGVRGGSAPRGVAGAPARS
jgi:hypothetical protein